MNCPRNTLDQAELDDDSCHATLSQPTPPMLVIGGVHDSQNPFSDVLLLLQSGGPKYAWVNPEGGHMGRSATLGDAQIFDTVAQPWIIARLAGPDKAEPKGN